MEETYQREPVDPSIFKEVLLAYKGCGQTLGELAAQARQVEKELDAWIDEIEVPAQRRMEG